MGPFQEGFINPKPYTRKYKVPKLSSLGCSIQEEMSGLTAIRVRGPHVGFRVLGLGWLEVDVYFLGCVFSSQDHRSKSYALVPKPQAQNPNTETLDPK